MRIGLTNGLVFIEANAAIAMMVAVLKPHTLAVTINGTVRSLIGGPHLPRLSD